MPEGLSPGEVSKELQHHNHAAHEGADAGGEPAHQTRDRWILIGEAVLLSLVTILTAWAGYAAAKWGTESRLQLAKASAYHTEANRAYLTALENKNFDASTFNAWFIAYTLGSPQKMLIAERRFTPEFKVAFDAWWATNPTSNPNSPPGPTYMPQYKQPELVKAGQLDAAGDAESLAGGRSGATGDNYVRITVLLAAVLFLVGIGSTFKVRSIRLGLMTVGTVLFITAGLLVLGQPRPPGG